MNQKNKKKVLVQHQLQNTDIISDWLSELKKQKVKKEKILDEGVSKKILPILRKIVSSKEGTANLANVNGYEIGTCDGLYEQSLDVSRSLVGWNVKLDIPSIFMPGELARPSGSEYKDYYQLSIVAVDSNDDEYKTLQRDRKSVV